MRVMEGTQVGAGCSSVQEIFRADQLGQGPWPRTIFRLVRGATNFTSVGLPAVLVA